MPAHPDHRPSPLDEFEADSVGVLRNARSQCGEAGLTIALALHAGGRNSNSYAR